MHIQAYLARNLEIAAMARANGHKFWARAILMQVRFVREGIVAQGVL
jgi:hypothetical protein